MARTMRGASADALADLTSILVGKLGGGADASRIGDDLFTVSSLLRAEAALRRVATDVSVDAGAKKGLVTDLFGGKVDEVSLDLVTEVEVGPGHAELVGEHLDDSTEVDDPGAG